jgi:hypothetical protein
VRDRWRVAILDSGLSEPGAAPRSHRALVASRRFVDTGRDVVESAATRDEMGHGTDVSEVICGAPRPVDLLMGQVLDHPGVTTAAALAAAIGWALDEGANLIHMSLGLRADRPVLALAVQKALKSGCIVVASAPARGEKTYPACYPNVIRATGDARCQRDEISALDSTQADFGACSRKGSGGADPVRHGGASIGAAHLTRFLIGRVEPTADVVTVWAQLRAMAAYFGPEIRLGGHAERGSKLQQRGAGLGNLHVSEPARATTTLEQRNTQQPDVDN